MKKLKMLKLSAKPYKKIIVFCTAISCSFLLSSCATTNKPNLHMQSTHHANYGPHTSLSKTLQLARNGNSQAQYAMGYRYYYGIGVKENINRAKSWLYRSATNGNSVARKALNDIKRWQGDQSPEDAAVVYHTPRPAYVPPPPSNRHEFADELAPDTGSDYSSHSMPSDRL